MEQLSCCRVLPLLSNMCVKCVFVCSNLIQWLRAKRSATSCQSSDPLCLPPTHTTPTASRVSEWVSELPWRVFRFSTCNSQIWWWKGRVCRCCWVNSGAFTSHHVSRGLCGRAASQQRAGRQDSKWELALHPVSYTLASRCWKTQM